MLWRDRYGYRGMWPSNSMWRELRRLQRDMDHLLGGTRGPVRAKFPAVNVWVGDEGVTVKAEIPGVAPDDLDISVMGETLTLSGKREMQELPEGAQFHRRERGYGEFSRTLELPFRVDAGQVKASFRNGILNMELPRLPEDKPKKITVKSG